MKKIALLLIITALLLAACGKSGGGSSHGDMPGMDQSRSPQAGHGTDAKQGSDVQAKFALSIDKPQPNQDTTVTIQIQDKNGKAIKNLIRYMRSSFI